MARSNFHQLWDAADQTPGWANTPISHESSVSDASGNCSDASYSLITLNRTPVVNPGETVEIEVLLSGYGFPDENKLYISWSSPYVVNRDNPGTFELYVSYETISPEGDWRLTTGKESLRTHNLKAEAGVAYVLTRGYFLKTETQEGFPDYGLEGVIGEWHWDGEPPILLSINTAQDSPQGDYEIQFVFTYSCGQQYKQDYKVVQFNVRSGWERNQWKWIIAGVTVALLSLVVTAIGIVYQIKKRQDIDKANSYSQTQE